MSNKSNASSENALPKAPECGWLGLWAAAGARYLVGRPALRARIGHELKDAFQELLTVAGQLGLIVRHARLGGSGGGLAMVKQQRQLFVDLDADAADQIERTLAALANVDGLDAVYVRPDVRELLERHRKAR